MPRFTRLGKFLLLLQLFYDPVWQFSSSKISWSWVFLAPEICESGAMGTRTPEWFSLYSRQKNRVSRFLILVQTPDLRWTSELDCAKQGVYVFLINNVIS